jgi:ribonuclease Z
VPKVVILGSSNAIATAHHDNTHMVLIGDERTVLIDCVSSPVVRLEQAGVKLDQLSDVILTHFHPDHVSGVPLLLMDMWLMGRTQPLTVHGLQYTLDRIEQLMGFYGWERWPNFYHVTFHRVPEEDMSELLDSADFKIASSPVQHLLPTIGLRVRFNRSGKVMAYSADTEPCPQVVRLAGGADLLIHEAAGKGRGHSSAEQAGQIAEQAEADRLLLIHYPTGKFAVGDIVAQAKTRFQGTVSLAEDFMELDFD